MNVNIKYYTFITHCSFIHSTHLSLSIYIVNRLSIYVSSFRGVPACEMPVSMMSVWLWYSHAERQTIRMSGIITLPSRNQILIKPGKSQDFFKLMTSFLHSDKYHNYQTEIVPHGGEHSGRLPAAREPTFGELVFF